MKYLKKTCIIKIFVVNFLRRLFLPLWRNWQTHTTQNRAGNHVGSSPTIGTRIKSGWRATFLYERKRWGSKRNVPSLGWFKARLNAGKNSPVDYFCDARASGPTIGTRIKVALEKIKKSIVFWKKIKKISKNYWFFYFYSIQW